MAHGYGSFFHPDTKCAHRVAWILMFGPLFDGAVVCHKCDNPACVRPDHLFVGTHADNMADKVAKGRQTKGEANYNAKLTEGDVREIRALADSGVPNKHIAQQFKLDRSTVSHIRSRKRWAHVA